MFTAPAEEPGEYGLGPFSVELAPGEGGLAWAVTNRFHRPLALRAVRVSEEARAGERVRLFRNGYQSWSRSGLAVLGADEDPSRRPDVPEWLRGMWHADADVAAAGELRSELVTVVDFGTGDPYLALGFLGGADHDGTIRLRRPEPGAGAVTVVAEAFLGGAVLAPGERRALHPVRTERGEDPAPLLERWADRFGTAAGARTSAPYQLGWSSWYHYFGAVTEADLDANLAVAGDWPFDLFQLDDGYQSAIGDWLSTNERFPSPLQAIAGRVAAAGLTPGIWLAPFLAGPDSTLVAAHPDWPARTADGAEALLGMWNPGWGGPTHALDTTREDVLAHIEAVAAELAAAGFPYLKLDFTYAPSLPGLYADPSRTPAQRVRAGLDAVRRGAGEAAFLLGCGCPLGPAVGVVDGMRIGTDVAPYWAPTWSVPGYEEESVSTRNAWRNTLTRSFMHRRLWVNDPDCVMLRTKETDLDEGAVRAWALGAGVSGGTLVVSDDLALLGPEAAALLGEAATVGHEVDLAARQGRTPRCDDLFERATPGRLSAGRWRLVADPDVPAAELSRV